MCDPHLAVCHKVKIVSLYISKIEGPAFLDLSSDAPLEFGCRCSQKVVPRISLALAWFAECNLPQPRRTRVSGLASPRKPTFSFSLPRVSLGLELNVHSSGANTPHFRSGTFSSVTSRVLAARRSVQQRLPTSPQNSGGNLIREFIHEFSLIQQKDKLLSPAMQPASPSSRTKNTAPLTAKNCSGTTRATFGHCAQGAVPGMAPTSPFPEIRISNFLPRAISVNFAHR